MTEPDRRFRTVLENRHEVLEHLLTHSATKPELVDALDTSRSTVDRAIRDLTETGCVTESGAEYVATTTGRLAFDEFDRYRTGARSVRKTREFLDYLPADAPLDTAILTGATVTLSEAHAPDRALAPSIDLFERATALEGLAPVVLTLYPDVIANRGQRRDRTVEIIAETAVIETLPTLASSQVESLLNDETVSLLEASESLPYALWLMETPDGEYAGITAYDSGGVGGVLINDSAEAVRWARERYADVRATARPVSSSRF